MPLDPDVANKTSDCLFFSLSKKNKKQNDNYSIYTADYLFALSLHCTCGLTSTAPECYHIFFRDVPPDSLCLLKLPMMMSSGNGRT